MHSEKRTGKKQPRHLHIFGISLLTMVALLLGCLFGVKMEAVAPASGTVTARHLTALRVRHAGLIDLRDYRVGDTCDAGTEIAVLQPEAGKSEAVSLRIPKDGLHSRWRILEMPVSSGQWVAAGSLVASVAPMDADTGEVSDLLVKLDIDEKHFGGLQIGQPVRLASGMFHHRIHGMATGKLLRLEPMGEATATGNRKFHAWAEVVSSPFPLKPGSSLRAAIITARKPTWQVILER